MRLFPASCHCQECCEDQPLKPERLCSPPHPLDPFDHFWCGRASCHWWQGRFFYEKLCTIFLSVQLPYLLDWKLSYPLLLGLQTLDFQQPCASLQTQLNPNCPLHLGKDTSSPTEAVADFWTNWSHWFNKLCSSPVFPNIPFVTLPFPYDIFRPPVPHPCHP